MEKLIDIIISNIIFWGAFGGFCHLYLKATETHHD